HNDLCSRPKQPRQEIRRGAQAVDDRTSLARSACRVQQSEPIRSLIKSTLALLGMAAHQYGPESRAVPGSPTGQALCRAWRARVSTASANETRTEDPLVN